MEIKAQAKVDRLVLGTAGLAGIWGKVDKEESVKCILFALESGVQNFDTAPAYSDAESILGNALKQWSGARPFISTKIGKLSSAAPDDNRYDFTIRHFAKSLSDSLRNLNVEFIDVLFLHDPINLPQENLKGVIRFMQEMKAQGLVRATGIGGNFPNWFSKWVSKEHFDVFMGYNRLNIICNDALRSEYELAKKNQIEIWQASPLYMGLLGSKFDQYQQNEASWIPKEHIARAKRLKAYCELRGLQLPDVSLRFFLNQFDVLSKVVIGASNLTEVNKSLESWNAGPHDPSIINEIESLINSNDDVQN